MASITAAETPGSSASQTTSTPNTNASQAAARRYRGASTHGSQRIFCPVVGCPEASISSNKNFRTFASIKPHLNDHCTGHLSGAIPTDFLTQNDYSQCRICDKILHKRYHGTCFKCRPIAHAQEQMNILRGQVNPTGDIPAFSQQATSSQDPLNLPTLSIIHEKYVPTIKKHSLGITKALGPMSSKSNSSSCLGQQ